MVRARLVSWIRRSARAAATRWGGLPHSTGTVDSASTVLAGDITRLWISNARSRERMTSQDGASVVCMTTHGGRVKHAWLALESIGRGIARPARLILWLEEGTRTTWRLRRQRRRGLEIIRVPRGLGVHTKHRGYAISAADHTMPMVLCDDDIVYPPTWLAGLLDASRVHPDCVVAYRCHAMRLDGDRLMAYQSWPTFDQSLPSFAAFATSVSGQLLPAPLVDALRDAGEEFLDLAPTADDVWLHRVAVANGYRTVQVERHPVHFPFIPSTQVDGLNAENVWAGGNDRQLARTHRELLGRIRVDAERDQALVAD